MNAYNTPEISVQEVAKKLQTGEKFTIIDVRETWEIEAASIKDDRVVSVSMSQISLEGQNAFPKPARDFQGEYIVMCHHGVRSANVAAWMLQQGWQNVSSLAGGIAEYAEEIDPSVGMY